MISFYLFDVQLRLITGTSITPWKHSIYHIRGMCLQKFFLCACKNYFLFGVNGGPTPKILLLKHEVDEKKIAETFLQAAVLQDSAGDLRFAVEQ